MDALISLLLIFAVVGIYLGPGLIALNRGHRNVNAIGALNIFLGWTFLGWVVALIWSLTDNTQPRVNPYRKETPPRTT